MLQSLSSTRVRETGSTKGAVGDMNIEGCQGCLVPVKVTQCSV